MRRPGLIPLALFVAALTLRVVGLGFFLPQQSDPDDHAIDQLLRLRTGGSEFDYSWGKYGQLVARTLWLLPPAATDAPLDVAHLEEHLRVASSDHLRARWISALLGALVAPATYWLARRWLTSGWSVVAAVFTASSLLHVSFSQQARPHAPFATLALLGVLAALRLRRSPVPRAAALFALALFFAAGTLHSAAFLIPAGLAAFWLREPGTPRLPARWLALPLAALAAALLLFWPFLFGGGTELHRGGRDVPGAFPHLVEAWMFNGDGFRVWYEALRGYDPLLLATAALGAVCALAHLVRRRDADGPARRDAAVVLAFALPFVVAFGVFGRSFERFFLPLYPALGVLAALALRDLASVANRALPALRGACGPLLACCALALPVYAAGRLVGLRAQPDTFSLAARALEQLDPSHQQALLLHPRAILPVAGRLVGDDAAAELPSAWMRYLADRGRAGLPTEGRPLRPFPRELQRLVRPHGETAEAAALLGALPDLGCTFALDILPDRDADPGTLNDALRSCADIAWQLPGGADGVFAENGYQEPDMLHVVLTADQWGPRLALCRFR